MKHLIKILTFLVVVNAQAQQDALYDQYMFSETFINPAFAGQSGEWNFTALNRYQWANVEGAPRLIAFSADKEWDVLHNSVGINIVNESVGVSKVTYANFMYAYKIQLNESKISFGAQASFCRFTSDLTSVNLANNNDEAFESSTVVNNNPNFGAGILYYSKKYYFSFSVPHIINFNNRASVIGNQVRHYIFSGGYNYEINDQFQVKPNFLVMAVSGAPLITDLNLNIEYQKRLWAGLSFRNKGRILYLLQAGITKDIRVGYAYGSFINQDAKDLRNSHEIMINYIFRKKSNSEIDKIDSPRYF